ncbi:unnamed protein product [Ranitomeya imitator]|uniref:Uncharacterized protein n=1 Tax=Ranitomeya imitator TaxID=111125 RepID=A0ABN9L6D9_9NEOB|nr:unnamed protein product [Ranitomeya imitator]
MGGLEGGIRVPGILRWPGVLPASTIIDKATSLMDIYSTVAKLGGGMPPQDRIIDGKDLMPLLQGMVPNSDHEFMFHYCAEYLHAVRWQHNISDTVWKVHYISPKFTPEGAGACYGSKVCGCSDEKVIYHVPPLLYNLSNDPSEKNPLPTDSDLYNEVLQTIQKAVAHHNATLHAREYKLAPYLEKLENPKDRQILSRYRLSAHSLLIESGRHRQNYKPRENRLCQQCPQEAVEDEAHFLLRCPKYSAVRDTHFKRLSDLLSDFTSKEE